MAGRARLLPKGLARHNKLMGCVDKGVGGLCPAVGQNRLDISLPNPDKVCSYVKLIQIHGKSEMSILT